MEIKQEPVIKQQIKVINVGIELFAESLQEQGVEVVHVTWEPPAKGDPELMNILSELL
ncbi:MAG: hypothetical protein JXA42_04070 [Anaerolineales bacterium]|nr:hypothetical protein [Anaerolineales bacterium]